MERIAIVGGGLSGLHAAHLLAFPPRLGPHCHTLHASDWAVTNERYMLRTAHRTHTLALCD